MFKNMEKWNRQKGQTKNGPREQEGRRDEGKERRSWTEQIQTLCLLFPQAIRGSASINFHDDKKKTSGYSSLLHPAVYELLRWRTYHRRHRLGVNRAPFIGVDTAGGPIRQPEHGWGRGRPMLSEPLRLTRLLGTLQTSVKLGKLPENMSPCVWYPC